MKEIQKPDVSQDDLLTAVAKMGQYGQKIVKQQVKMIDNLADSFKPADGTKRLTNTAHDKALAAERTIHDVMADNPARLAELRRIFGNRGL